MALSLEPILADESGCFTIIAEGFHGDFIEAAVAMLYRGEVPIGADSNAGEFRGAFTELILPDSEVNFGTLHFKYRML